MKIALLTCAALPNLRQSDQFLITALARHSIDAKPVVWNDQNIVWTDFEYLIFRNTWDYYEKEIDFNVWLHKIQALQIKTLNPIAVINQNKHKFYLRNLELAGIKILPTVFIDKTNTLDIEAVIPGNWQKAVIKPAFSAGSYQTEVFNSSDCSNITHKYKTIAAEKELLLQQFMPEIQSCGETSFIFFNKKYSHSVNKMPAAGDFRIQEQFGGLYTLVHPNQSLIDQAQKVVETFFEPLLYARVDGIIINNQLHLMEIECIEPDLYFDLDKNAQTRFVAEIMQIIS